MYIATRQGQTALTGQSFDVNRNFSTFIHLLQVSKICLWSLILYNFFYDLIHVYSPQGTKFWCQQKGLITWPICCKFQKNVFEVWFYTIFHEFIHVHSPGAGADSPQGTVLMSTETSNHFVHLLQVSKICLWRPILYIFFNDLIPVYSLVSGGSHPNGDNVLMSTCHFGHLLLISNHARQ